MTEFSNLLDGNKVIPVVAVDDVDTACHLSEALLAGGVSVIEITLRTAAGLDAIRAVRDRFPAMLVGCGTIRQVDEVAMALDAGSQFLVSPGGPTALAKQLAAAPVPALPGAATVTEMMTLFDLGFATQKFFPAGASGGPAMLKGVHPILPEISFCPTGGVSADTLNDYLACPNVICVGGSWLAPNDLINARDWASITKRAEDARAL
ncbi:MAG: bifunctional 4-hydroxy-2-oxoglutarate aldolase/2-dehydro-3-deoxy-phosphogluconate aldolase [Alphaproteobacteria bacterium]